GRAQPAAEKRCKSRAALSVSGRSHGLDQGLLWHNRSGTDPLILDLDGDGVETTHLKDGAYFDHQGDGFAEQTGWAASDDGLLVLDSNGDGIINDGRELFGDQTVLKSGAQAAHGFAALAEWDANRDVRITKDDPVWSQLRIWQEMGDTRTPVRVNPSILTRNSHCSY
ncbi:MAG: hypothetical protein HXY24_13780, partial [Rubrivivax sp.]|nr:hypothetical protein [Rubrivivax sp.]